MKLSVVKSMSHHKASDSKKTTMTTNGQSTEAVE